IRRYPLRRAPLDALEGLEGLPRVRGDVDRLVGPLRVDAVARVELHEVELLVGGGPEQSVEVVEDLGHEIPRRPGVPAEAVPLVRADATADLRVALEERHAVPLAREQRGGGEPADPAADD